MKNFTTVWMIRSVFVVIAAILIYTWNIHIALAQDFGSSVSIAPSGQVIVKGATVDSVVGTKVHAHTMWGGARLRWIVETSGSTRFTPDLGSSHMLKNIKKGHTISFTGTMLEHEGKESFVIASVLKDLQLVKESTSVVGVVESVDVKSGTFVLASADTKTTVVVARGALMSRDGGYMSIHDIAIGDQGKATGTLDATRGELAASRISLKTAPPPTQEAAEKQPQEGIFASLVRWLGSTRGILNVHDTYVNRR